MKILVTGFEPFGGESVNPSWEAAALLPDELNGAKIVKRQICVEYARAADELDEAIREIGPDIILCTGQAGGRAGVTPEVIAINMADASGADNAGVIKKGEKLIENAPDGIFATLPVREMVRAMNEEGIPASLSYSAGAFVCNCVMFHALCNAAPGAMAGFIHVPFSTSQAAFHGGRQPSMTIEDMARGLQICVRTAMDYCTKRA